MLLPEHLPDAFLGATDKVQMFLMHLLLHHSMRLRSQSRTLGRDISTQQDGAALRVTPEDSFRSLSTTFPMDAPTPAPAPKPVHSKATWTTIPPKATQSCTQASSLRMGTSSLEQDRNPACSSMLSPSKHRPLLPCPLLMTTMKFFINQLSHHILAVGSPSQPHRPS